MYWFSNSLIFVVGTHTGINRLRDSHGGSEKTAEYGVHFLPIPFMLHCFCITTWLQMMHCTNFYKLLSNVVPYKPGETAANVVCHRKGSLSVYQSDICME